MGADLYIESIFNPNYKKYEKIFAKEVQIRDSLSGQSEAYEAQQKKVHEAYEKMMSVGYFRDCYNGYGLLANLEIENPALPEGKLSWWRDVIPLLDDHNKLVPEKAKVLKDWVSNAKIVSKKVDPNYYKPNTSESENEPIWEKTPKQLEEYEAYKKELIDFLQQAIDLNESIVCSL